MDPEVPPINNVALSPDAMDIDYAEDFKITELRDQAMVWLCWQ